MGRKNSFKQYIFIIFLQIFISFTFFSLQRKIHSSSKKNLFYEKDYSVNSTEKNTLFKLIKQGDNGNFTKYRSSPLFPASATEVDKYKTDYVKTCVTSEEKRRQFLKMTISVTPFCPCWPLNLYGWENVSFADVAEKEIIIMNDEVKAGGSWLPSSCISRHSVAIIIPYRDRLSHLMVLLNRLHPVLQRQQLDYTIYLVEQRVPSVFNKAALMNIGFLESRKLGKHDCYIFHDVDMIMENDYHIYHCRDEGPSHLGAYHNRHQYRLIYGGIFGGVTALTEKQFLNVNGFSNRFFGWGGEDDNFGSRVRNRKYRIIRYAREVSSYRVIRHETDKGNLQLNRKRMLELTFHPVKMELDGLSSCVYNISKIEKRPLYTWIYADVNRYPYPDNLPTKQSP